MQLRHVSPALGAINPACRTRPVPSRMDDRDDVAVEVVMEPLGERDRTELWSLASNCGLYEADPQPALQNVGTRAEPLMVTAVEAWRDYYARWTLQQLDADDVRITSVRQWAVAERSSSTPRGQQDHRFGQQDWDCAIDLCDRALVMIRAAGSDTDDFARRRLLAGIKSALTTETLGFAPGVAEDAAEGLMEDLATIDADEGRAGH